MLPSAAAAPFYYDGDEVVFAQLERQAYIKQSFYRDQNRYIRILRI